MVSGVLNIVFPKDYSCWVCKKMRPENQKYPETQVREWSLKHGHKIPKKQ